MLFICYPKCSTGQKAKKWLDEHYVEYTERQIVNSKRNLQATGTTHNNEKCNGTGLVLKMCETKNNVWKKHELSIPNGIDNCIKIT